MTRIRLVKSAGFLRSINWSDTFWFYDANDKNTTYYLRERMEVPDTWFTIL